MYLSHFGLQEAPFRITPHTDFFFDGANRGATLEALLYTITHDEGIVKVSGEVGSGKTMLCRVMMERLPASVETIYLANPSLSRDEILIAIADELKLDLGSERSTRLIRSLQDHLIRLYSEGRRVVVLIDEAHAMPRETLEEIRLLSNLEANRHKLLQIVLFGQPELDELLNTSEMRQLKERITHSFRLLPMGHADIASYIDFRLRAAGYRGPNPFSAGALKNIVAASEGLTRRVNILADKALLAAFAANSHSVTEREVKRAIEDSEFYRAPRGPRRSIVAASGVATGLAVGFLAAWVWLERGSAPVNAAAAPAARVDASVAQPMVAVAETPAAVPAATPPAEPAAPNAASTPTPSRTDAPKQIPKLSLPGAAPAAGSENPASPPPGAVAPAKGRRVQERFAATQAWLEKAPDRHYAIQLLTVKDSEIDRLERFLAKASQVVPAEELHVYGVKIDGVQHYRAAYGDFSDASATQEALKDLPPLFRALNPYQRTVERMKSQNRQ
jgi:type II secretory pathway predicted ATPase ExeA/septal ring-binding cell division protein DamX